MRETEPFDWFSDERSVNLPDLPVVHHPLPAQSLHTVPAKNQPATYNPPYDIPEYESEGRNFVTSSYYYNSRTGQPQLPYSGYYPSNHISAEYLPDIPEINYFVNEPVVLTPPGSPEDEEIIKFLQDIGPEDLERLMLNAPSSSPNSSDLSEGGSSISFNDEMSDWGVNVSSESSCDDDYFISNRICARLRPIYRRLSTKMYARQTEEQRRLRKKEQNKNAAIRYRLKKKQQAEQWKTEEKCLQDQNRQLTNQMEDVTREIRCLKSLMRDVYRKKGLVIA